MLNHIFWIKTTQTFFMQELTFSINWHSMNVLCLNYHQYKFLNWKGTLSKVFDILIVKIQIQNISYIIGHEDRFSHININLLLYVPITHLISSKSLIILNILNQELRIWKQPKLNGWWAFKIQIYKDGMNEEEYFVISGW